MRTVSPDIKACSSVRKEESPPRIMTRKHDPSQNAVGLAATLIVLGLLGGTYIVTGAVPGSAILILAGLVGFVLILVNRFVGLAILLGSYTYCLPVVHYGFQGEHDLRVYDFVIVALMLAYLSDTLMGKSFIIAKTSINKPLLYFVVFCLFSLIVVALSVGYLEIPRAGLRWFRLAGYALAFILVTSLPMTKKQINILLNVFLIGAAVQGLLSTLQSLGFLGPLWDYHVLDYSPFSYVGTMAPHHVHLRLYLVSALAVLVAKAKTPHGAWGKVGLAACSGLLIYPLFNTHCRTGILAFGVYGAMTLILSKKRAYTLVGASIGLLVLFLSFGKAPFEIGQEEVQKQIDTMQTPTGYDLTRLDTRRMHIYSLYGERLAGNPAILLWGSGYEFGWGGAHNCYANVFFELGPFGLLIWLWLLLRIWKRTTWLAKRSEWPEARVLAREFLCLFIALLVANLTTEVLYPRRALYSFFAQFLFLAALVLHPVWGKPEQVNTNRAQHNPVAKERQ